MDGMDVEAERNAPEDVGVEELLSIAVLESLCPIGGSELESAPVRPARQEAQEIAQVAGRLDVVQSTAGEQRNEGGVDVAGFVAAKEKPIFPADHFPTERALTDVVVCRQRRIPEELLKGSSLVSCVADPFLDWRVIQDAGCLDVTPIEEARDDRFGLACSHGRALAGRSICDRSLDTKQLTDERERLAGAIGIGRQRLEKVASRVRPTCNFGHVTGGK